MSVPRRFRVLAVLLCALVLGPLAAWSQQKPACSANTTVNSPAGSLCGTSGPNNVTAYLGIPFAQPPVGNLRWKNPQPPSPWSGTFQATQMSSGCPQPNTLGLCSAGMSEDCLYLNVWVPANTTSSSNLPVMVFIYGGAFLIGSDALPGYDGASLASAGNVIVVNLNYRLGALGFLTLDGITDADHNNFGFRDQIQALTWVQKNIASFGGNPDNVTIFGESAGAMSVGLHALSSPQSSGLFKAAIMESNPLGIAYVDLDSQQAKLSGTSFASKLGCSGPNTASCVQGITDACTLIQKEFQVTRELFSEGMASLPWAPVIDGTLIKQQPMAAAEAGALKMPMLLGTNLNEGNVFAALIKLARAAAFKGAAIKQTDYSTILKNVFGKDKATLIQSQGVYDCKDNLCGDILARVINDYAFACANRHLATQAKSGIYAYQFTQISGNDCNPWPELALFGAHCANSSCHGAEVPYVFNTPEGVGTKDKCTFSSDEKKLSNLMGGYWTRFAKQQDPAGTPDWQSFKPNNTYMVLNGNSSATAIDPWNSGSNCAFWDQIGYPATPPPAVQTDAKR